MAKIKDLTGQVFGRLIVISRAESNKWGASRWNCLCDCGTEITIQGGHLKSGATQSCGCLNTEVVTKHGHSKVGNKSPIYQSWENMIQRCTNSNHRRYKDYMGRGITVCERWLNFENFLEDMGERPSKWYTIDRINNGGNYCKENCKWSTKTEQQRNTRANIHLAFNGETKLQEDWAKEWGIQSSSIWYHLSKGRSMEWIYENKTKKTN